MSRRTAERSGGRRRGDPSPLPISPQSLDMLVDALEQFAVAIPPGHELFTAIYDLEAGASDLVIRDQDGDMRFVLGLPDAQHERLGALLAWVRNGLDPTAEADGPVAFRAIVEQCPVPLIVVRRDGTIDYASPAVATALEMGEPADLEGTLFTEFVHDADRDSVFPLAHHAPRGQTATLRLRRSDGRYLSVDITARNLPNERRILLALQPAQPPSEAGDLVIVAQRHRALAEVADCGTALINARAPGFGRVIAANAAFGRITATPPDRVTGRAIWDLVSEHDAARVLDAARRVADGEGSRSLTVRVASEIHRHVELDVGLDRGSGDPPAQLTIRLRDVTGRDGLISALQLQVDRLEQQNAELAALTETTAQGLMSPLRAVSGLVDLLVPSAGEGSAQALAAVQSAVARMLSMLDGAVAVAAVHTGPAARREVDLNVALDVVTASLAADLSASRAHLAVTELPVVNGDRAQLEQVLCCLLANAIAAARRAAPAIAIGAELYGEMWRIAVTDEGTDLEPGACERMFALGEPGGRGVGDLRRSAGIGLATCRRIIEQHGGQMWVEASEPQGASFFFTLPAEP